MENILLTPTISISVPAILMFYFLKSNLKSIEVFEFKNYLLHNKKIPLLKYIFDK